MATCSVRRWQLPHCGLASTCKKAFGSVPPPCGPWSVADENVPQLRARSLDTTPVGRSPPPHRTPGRSPTRTPPSFVRKAQERLLSVGRPTCPAAQQPPALLPPAQLPPGQLLSALSSCHLPTEPPPPHPIPTLPPSILLAPPSAHAIASGRRCARAHTHTHRSSSSSSSSSRSSSSSSTQSSSSSSSSNDNITRNKKH